MEKRIFFCRRESPAGRIHTRQERIFILQARFFVSIAESLSIAEHHFLYTLHPSHPLRPLHHLRHFHPLRPLHPWRCLCPHICDAIAYQQGVEDVGMQKTDDQAVGKVRPRFLSCVLNIHRRHPGNSQMLCKLAATHAPPRVEVRHDRLQPKKPPRRDSTLVVTTCDEHRIEACRGTSLGPTSCRVGLWAPC
jgi:hypothetical protein